jgi:hypothetical protein
MKSATLSQMNISVQRAPAAANKARSAQAAPHAVKTCTENAAATRSLVGSLEELAGGMVASRNPIVTGKVPQVNHKPT